MRNLSLYKSSRASLAGIHGTAAISAVTVDLDQDALYVTSERPTADADVEVQVWRIGRGQNLDVEDIEREEDAAVLVTTFTSPAYLASNPWSSPFAKPSEVVSLRLLPDTRTFTFIMRGGDIATAALDEEVSPAEVVGSVESGILAASWSPDDSLVALVTGDDKLILMTSTFDVLSESALHTSEFGEEAPINVGWGSKQTQFHGSLGKAAAQAPKPATIGSSPDDDGLPRISWRGDGAYFVVSSLSPPSPSDTRRRKFRTYSHAGVLQSTSELTPGLEHTLAWRPSGNWIVGTQRFGFPGGGEGREGRHDVVLFERNGLRRGEFGLDGVLAGRGRGEGEEAVRKWGYRVREVGWSSDSNVLSVWVEHDTGDVVQFWTIGNYHWYLKHEICAPRRPDGRVGRFTSASWHPEDALKIILTTSSEIIQRTYGWETSGSRSQPPNDSGTVAVLDGAAILLTPFRTQNVPPPMSSYRLPLPAPSLTDPTRQSLPPVHVSFYDNRDLLAALWETGYVELTDLHTRLGPGQGKVMEPTNLWTGTVNEETTIKPGSSEYRQILFWKPVADESYDMDVTMRLAALGSSVKEDVVSIVVLRQGEVIERCSIPLSERNGRLIRSDRGIAWQVLSGEIYAVDPINRLATPIAKFPEFCFEAEQAQVTSERNLSAPDGGVMPQPESSLFVGLSQSGRLHVSSPHHFSQTLSSNANSFFIASGFLVFTTTAHMAHFAPLNALSALLKSTEDPKGVITTALPEWETRRVERGSRIVTAVPSTMSLVLQMPRGNLETINPRPLVMDLVRKDIDSGNYAKAFAACRRHRIDLNVFVEHNREAFVNDLTAFVEQVADVDYINLFLTNIGQGPLASEVINQLCDGIRMELEKRDLKKYINSILTAHVVKKPADHEAGLALLLHLQDTDSQLVEDAVKYIIFLVDADRLFDTALGMYDFSLVLMIAQHAQKDPREYLPFLRELRALDKFYQRFKIDDHLKRHEKALQSLSLAGTERFDEAMAYVEKHKLYNAALSIWRGTDHYETVLGVYGDWLFERREFRDAAFVFRRARKFAKAMIAHEKALDWQELFDLAIQENTSAEDLSAIGYRIAEDLSSKKRYQDAARVLLDYVKDVREAVIALVQGNYFSEARRIITLHARLELVQDIVHPAALESRAQIAEELSEMREQLRKQVQRLRELRVKKVEEPDAFFGVEDVELHNVDVMTDVSMPGTTFTRYTVAPSTASRTSKRSSRSKRKLERKVGSGRKGTVDEEEYLLKSVTKLVGRFGAAQADAVNLLPHLFQFTEEHRQEGLALQDEIADFERELREGIEEIWKKPQEAEEEPATAESWAARMQEHEKQRLVDPLEKVVKPDLARREWNRQLADIDHHVERSK